MKKLLELLIGLPVVVALFALFYFLGEHCSLAEPNDTILTSILLGMIVSLIFGSIIFAFLVFFYYVTRCIGSTILNLINKR